MSFVRVVRVLALVLAVGTSWSFASPLSASRLSSSLHRAAGSQHSHVARGHHRAGGHVLVATSRHRVSIVATQSSIGAPLPSAGVPESPIGQSNSRFKTFVAPRRHIVPFIGFADSPNVTVIVPQTPVPAEESVVIEPRSPTPAVFFIEKCGKFIRVPLPEAQTESFSKDHEKCE
jgi:hypothetical protein